MKGAIEDPVPMKGAIEGAARGGRRRKAKWGGGSVPQLSSTAQFHSSVPQGARLTPCQPAPLSARSPRASVDEIGRRVPATARASNGGAAGEPQ